METYYIIKLNDEGYFTGMYGESSSKKIAKMNGILVDSLPPNPDTRLWPAYKLINGEWILDEEKLRIIQERISKQETIEKKYFEIEELKNKLNNTDYNAIKCLEQIIKHFETILPLGEYKTIGSNRESWRKQINKLEEEIKKIEEGGSN